MCCSAASAAVIKAIDMNDGGVDEFQGPSDGECRADAMKTAQPESALSETEDPNDPGPLQPICRAQTSTHRWPSELSRTSDSKHSVHWYVSFAVATRKDKGTSVKKVKNTKTQHITSEKAKNKSFAVCAARWKDYENFRECIRANNRTYETIEKWDQLATRPQTARNMTPQQRQAQFGSQWYLVQTTSRSSTTPRSF